MVRWCRWVTVHLRTHFHPTQLYNPPNPIDKATPTLPYQPSKAPPPPPPANQHALVDPQALFDHPPPLPFVHAAISVQVGLGEGRAGAAKQQVGGPVHCTGGGGGGRGGERVASGDVGGRVATLRLRCCFDTQPFHNRCVKQPEFNLETQINPTRAKEAKEGDKRTRQRVAEQRARRRHDPRRPQRDLDERQRHRRGGAADAAAREQRALAHVALCVQAPGGATVLSLVVVRQRVGLKP